MRSINEPPRSGKNICGPADANYTITAEGTMRGLIRAPGRRRQYHDTAVETQHGAQHLPDAGCSPVRWIVTVENENDGCTNESPNRPPLMTFVWFVKRLPIILSRLASH